MLFFKSCPRCQGDMHVNRDIYGNYKECLQCGHIVNLRPTSGIRSVPVPGSRNKKKVA